MNRLFILFVCGFISLSGSISFGQRGGPQRGGPGFSGGSSGKRIAPQDLEFEMGVASIPNLATFSKLSYQGTDVGRDPYLKNLQYVKFVIENPQTKIAAMYFMNTGNYRAHPPSMRMVGLESRDAVRGAISYLPRMKNAQGGAGLYIFDFQPNDSFAFEKIKYIRDALVENAPFLNGLLAFHPLSGGLAQYERDKQKYDASDVMVHLDSDLYRNIAKTAGKDTRSIHEAVRF